MGILTALLSSIFHYRCRMHTIYLLILCVLLFFFDKPPGLPAGAATSLGYCVACIGQGRPPHS